MGARAIPGLRYADAHAAIDWLCRVLGFEVHLVVPDDTGDLVAHAQLVLDDAIMVMLGSVRDDALDAYTATPAETGGRVTQSAYLVLPDVAAHYSLAVAAGADIVTPLTAQHYGGLLYTCRDPEGHLWNIGSYDPWAPPSA